MGTTSSQRHPSTSSKSLDFTNVRIHRLIALVSCIVYALFQNQSNDLFVTSQIIGTDICACQPSTYQLILNLSLSCSDTTVENTIPGILDRACQVESRGSSENITDPFPVTIGSIIVSELDENRQAVGQTTYRGPYTDGDIITYTSIILSDPDSVTAETIPRGFQVVLTGLNLAEETLTNTWIVEYENDCSIFPLLTKGEQIGWTIFVSIKKQPSTCKINTTHISCLLQFDFSHSTCGLHFLLAAKHNLGGSWYTTTKILSGCPNLGAIGYTHSRFYR
jgi:hypothetical protein